MADLYDSIGQDYRHYRQPDSRIHGSLVRALSAAVSVVNVGAGAGSYEPRDRFVIAVEPSMVMIGQRPASSASAVRALADDLPFRDGALDASTAILTIHHWPDWRRGVRELARVARQRVVILTWDPSSLGFWLVDDYFPELLDLDRQIFPSIEDLRLELGRVDVERVEIAHDCRDGFLGAYWRRPEAYLLPGVRRAISSFSRIANVDSGLARLQHDLKSGVWRRRYGRLLGQTSLDLGYRILVAPLTGPEK